MSMLLNKYRYITKSKKSLENAQQENILIKDYIENIIKKGEN